MPKEVAVNDSATFSRRALSPPSPKLYEVGVVSGPATMQCAGPNDTDDNSSPSTRK
jgi:hypothetical protein